MISSRGLVMLHIIQCIAALANGQGVSDKALLWPNGIIPYAIDRPIGPASTITALMQDIQNKTCIKFVHVTTEKNSIKFYTTGPGCFSAVGMLGGVQAIFIGQNCAIGIILQQLGHAIGFYFEHNRSDRDEYVKINHENIEPRSDREFALLKPKDNILYQPFDYDSVMIFGNYDYSENGKETIVAKNGVKLVSATKKRALSKYDVIKFNKLYGCHHA